MDRYHQRRWEEFPQEKLPLICREWGITHIVFTPGIISKGFVTQKNAVAGVWEQLFQLHRLAPK